MPHPIIYINSWPGVGKHTIARALKRRFGAQARVVHNHHHIDLASAILPRSNPGHQDVRRQLRSALFNTLATCPDTYGHIYIFTDFQSDNELGPSVAQEYADAAKARGCAFVPVILTCRAEENARRMQSSERVEKVACGKGMLLDATLLMEMRDRGEIHEFQLPGQLKVDVSDLRPEEVAATIAKHVGAVCADPH